MRLILILDKPAVNAGAYKEYEAEASERFALPA
jgi:hypothetical protein